MGGTGGTGFSGIDQVLVIRGDQDANSQGAQNIEEQNTPEDSLDGLGNVSAGIFGLTRGNSDHLHPTIRECGIDESGPETEETTSVTTCNIRLHGARISPVVETKARLAWNTAEVDDEGEDEKADDGDDLDGGKDEFGFSIDGDGEDVETEDQNNDDGDPSGDIGVPGALPKLDDGGSSGNFGAQGNGAGIPVVPAYGETHGVINIASTKLGNGTWERKPGCHFSQGEHHGEDGQAGEGIAEEDGERTSLEEGPTNTKEETGTDCATEGDELDVTGLETSGNVTVLFGGGDIAVDVGGLIDPGASSGLKRRRSCQYERRTSNRPTQRVAISPRPC